MDYQIIVKPLAGAVIGYSTNWLAIKMLFKPHQAKYIGKFKVPFTPGLIPRERERIAKSLGYAVGSELLTHEVILNELTNEKVILSIRDYIMHQLTNKDILIGMIIDKIFSDNAPVIERKIVCSLTGQLKEMLHQPQTYQLMFQEIRAKLQNQIQFDDKIDSIIPDKFKSEIDAMILDKKELIAAYISSLIDNESVKLKIGEMVSAIVLEKVGAFGAMFLDPSSIATLIVEKIKLLLSEEQFMIIMANKLTRAKDDLIQMKIGDLAHVDLYEESLNSISHTIANGAFDMLDSIDLEGVVDNLLTRVKEMRLHISYEDGLYLEKAIEKIYLEFAKEHIPVFLNNININDVVEKEINKFSVDSVERLIFGIVKNELNAITWLGALLGFGMGALSLLL